MHIEAVMLLICPLVPLSTMLSIYISVSDNCGIGRLFMWYGWGRAVKASLFHTYAPAFINPSGSTTLFLYGSCCGKVPSIVRVHCYSFYNAFYKEFQTNIVINHYWSIYM